MQTWMVPGAPRLDGWRLWYATAGAAPMPIRVERDHRELQVTWTVTGPTRLDGFSRTIYTVIAGLPPGEPPGASYLVTIPETGARHVWSTLPAALPKEGVTIIFGSCFWQQDDAEGELARACQVIAKLEHPRPLLKLLLGDQIYLDWPADIAPWRLRKGGHHLVGERYQRYWGDDAYRQYLAEMPNIVVGDDHEFWNDFPETQRHLPITYTARLRDGFGKAAHEYYRAFQAALNPQGVDQSWTIIDLPPLSIFVADTRSERGHVKDPAPRLMSDAQWTALERWQRELKGPGLLALGQPLFQPDGDWKDHSLSNFTDSYRRLLALIRNSVTGANDQGTPHNIVLLTGDIHNARSTYTTVPGVADTTLSHVHELVASASSAIGPYLKAPKASALPSWLPPGNDTLGFGPRWPVQRVPQTAPYDTVPRGRLYASVDNNLGVLRIRPHPTAPYTVELTHVSYLVRPYRRPFWQPFGRGDKAGPADAEARRLFTHTLDLR